MLQALQSKLQPLGRALMLPIAVLPVAALMLRLGQGDLLDIAFLAAAGSAIFAHLGLLFAIGVGVGLAKENHGAAGLAGAVAFLVLTEGAKLLMAVAPDAVPATITDTALRDTLIAAWKDKELAKLSVPAGILSGLSAGWLYNRYYAINLPTYFAFFGGRRFVPIAAGFAGLVGAALFGFGFPLLEGGVDALSHSVTGAGSFGLFAYGLLNRLLIVTGLHHILNNLAWFVVGDFGGVSGDLNRFFAGDKSAGAFMSGFFPVMMFGLPAGCLAMYRAARPERKKAVGGMLLSMALTSFLTGVTEPIEFTFMFLAPLLYLFHAVMTGISMVVMDAIGSHLGFGFSAGLFDYVLNYGLATRPLLLLPVGAAYFAIYYFGFAYAIRRFNLATPGREVEDVAAAGAPVAQSERGAAYAEALGGADNLRNVGACTTRLRLELVDRDLADTARLKALGVKGVIAIGSDGLQVVIGPEADNIAGEIRAALRGAPAVDVAPVVAVDKTDVDLPGPWLAALGGTTNVAAAESRGVRTIITLRSHDAIDHGALDALFPDRWQVTRNGLVHLISQLIA
ncbi:MAG: PTS transporter subunit EIIC [Sphingomonadaceae bacterium]|nr:PTS transporter subunit EIIC [Sphingomonadaceae bacterium]